MNRHFGVSRATSRNALNDLEARGYIVRRSRLGSIVLRKRVDQPAEK
ncbi:MAG: GntR family transcriptional regulator [Silicimonas sp.]|nr:GntR family transcriptional regulator [Silicimonas sp.]